MDTSLEEQRLRESIADIESEIGHLEARKNQYCQMLDELTKESVRKHRGILNTAREILQKNAGSLPAHELARQLNVPIRNLHALASQEAKRSSPRIRRVVSAEENKKVGANKQYFEAT